MNLEQIQQASAGVKKGKIVYLHGVTSTGKTSISEEIQSLAEENYYYLSNDLFQEIVSPRSLEGDYFTGLFDAILSMYHVARCLSDLGHNCIIDGMVTERPQYTRDGKSHYALVQSILGEELVIIELTCPVEECRRRNRERGDRWEAQSEEQMQYMSCEVEPLLTLDTSKLPPSECASQILRALQQ